MNIELFVKYEPIGIFVGIFLKGGVSLGLINPVDEEHFWVGSLLGVDNIFESGGLRG